MPSTTFYSQTLARDMTTRDAIAEIRRELKLRERVYPKLIAQGNLTMPQAIERYTRLVVALEALEKAQQPTLF